MPGITTDKITLPKEVAQGIVSKARDASTIQTLSPATPLIFADADTMVFTEEPEAEWVAEGGEHSSMDAKFKPVPMGRHKAHVTIRLSDEVEWADEDNQLQIVDAVTDSAAAAVGRGLDYGVYHAIDPSKGTVAAGMTALTAGANSVTATAKPQDDVDALVEKVNEDWDVTGIALSKGFANSLRKIRVEATGQRLYPEIPLNLKVGNFDGIAAATSSTVNGARAKVPTKVLAILGAFNLIRWGLVRDISMEIITMGDPDGNGDLKKLGHVAYRVELVYGWAVLDPKGFAVLKAA